MPHSAKSKLEALTGCRFIAASLVVCYHFLAPDLRGPKLFQSLISRGFLAVNFFFVLSGFVLVYKYADSAADPIEHTRFWSARFWRIYPTYLLALLLALSQHLTEAKHGAHALIKWSLGGLLTATCLQAWLPQTARFLNFPAWSVSCEAFFYALFPWLIVRLRPQSMASALRIVGVLWLSAMVAPGALMLGNRFGWHTGLSGWQTPVSIEELFVLHFPIFHLPSFAMGIVAGQTFLKHGPLTARRSIVWLVACAVVIVFACLSSISNEFLQNGALAPIFAIFIYALATKSQSTAILACTPMRALGNASYALYILQVPIFSSVAGYFHLQGTESEAKPLSYFLISFAILTAASLFVTRMATRTAQDRIARWDLPRYRAIETTGS